MTDEADVRRGRLAEDVLENPEYEKAFIAVNEWIYAEWCKPQSQESLNELRSLRKAHILHKAMMEQALRSGELAADKIIKRRPIAERLGMKYKAF